MLKGQGVAARSQPSAPLLQMVSVSNTPAITPGSRVSPPPCPTPLMNPGTCLLFPGAGSSEKHVQQEGRRVILRAGRRASWLSKGSALDPDSWGHLRRWEGNLWPVTARSPIPRPGVPSAAPSVHAHALVISQKLPADSHVKLSENYCFRGTGMFLRKGSGSFVRQTPP